MVVVSQIVRESGKSANLLELLAAEHHGRPERGSRNTHQRRNQYTRRELGGNPDRLPSAWPAFTPRAIKARPHARMRIGEGSRNAAQIIRLDENVAVVHKPYR